MACGDHVTSMWAHAAPPLRRHSGGGRSTGTGRTRLRCQHRCAGHHRAGGERGPACRWPGHGTASRPTPGRPAGPGGGRRHRRELHLRRRGRGRSRRAGIITFNCGPAPVTITMTATAEGAQRATAEVVLDGGGKVTLSGGGQRRILYMNTCDPHQGWTTSHCQNQATPQLTVQNLTFADGNSTGHTIEGGGGGAIFVRGGRFKVVNSRFVGNRCDRDRPGPRRRRDPARSASTRAGRSTIVQQHLHAAAGLLQRRRAEQHRRLLGGAEQRVHRQPGHRPRREPGPAGTPAAAAAARSTATATVHRADRRHGHRATTTPTRAAAPSSSSATTAPARCTSRTRRCGTTPATASRPRATQASSSSDRAPTRSSPAPA